MRGVCFAGRVCVAGVSSNASFDKLLLALVGVEGRNDGRRRVAGGDDVEVRECSLADGERRRAVLQPGVGERDRRRRAGGGEGVD